MADIVTEILRDKLHFKKCILLSNIHFKGFCNIVLSQITMEDVLLIPDLGIVADILDLMYFYH